MSDSKLSSQQQHSAQAVIEGYIQEWKMQPHPEGGWYREMHRSTQIITRANGECRPALTTILFLLEKGSISRWHQVHGADEVWIHLQGAPLSLWDLPERGGTATHKMLSLQHPIQTIPANHWQAACPEGPYCLVSCCVGPGFHFDDFTMLHDLPKEQWPVGALPELI